LFLLQITIIQTTIITINDAKQQVTVLPHHPCSLDLAPRDLFFFPCLKEKLHGHRFLSTKEIVSATREAICDLPANIIQQCFQQLYQRWQICVAANGDCFEGECEYVYVYVSIF
jgi:hypothetical protein